MKRTLSITSAMCVLLAACSVPIDANPRDLPLAQPTSTVASPSVAATTGQGVKLYFLDEVTGQPTKLRAVDRVVAPDAGSVVRELLGGLASLDDRTLRTAIPADTKLRSTPSLVDGTLTVDLSQVFFTIKGDQLILALAQLVFTVGGLEGVSQVQVLVEGESRDLPRGDGTRQRRTFVGSDFAALDPSSQPDYVIAPSPVLANSVTTIATSSTTTTSSSSSTTTP